AIVRADKVEDVVANLKSGAEKKTERFERVEIRVAAAGDQRPDPAGMDEAVPAGLLQGHPQIVGRTDREYVVTDPAKLHRLAFKRLGDQMIELVQHAPGAFRAESRKVAPEQAKHVRHHRVAYVDREGGAQLGMKARNTPPAFALVLDVVVDEKGVMQQLERGGGRQRVFQSAAEGPARCNKKRWANSLAGPGAEVAHRLVEVLRGFAVGQTFEQRIASKSAIFGKSIEKRGSVHRRVRLSA